ncbi:MAG: alpha/beta fold hydrolase [Anaerolineales bacterium]
MIQGDALEIELAKFRAAHPTRQLVHRGVEWHFYAGGMGTQSVLLLTGALGLAEFAFQQILLLEGKFRVLAPDYPPVGSLADLCGGLVRLLSEEHIPGVHVVGGSFGGVLAQALVRQASERVASVVLSHTGAPDGRRRRGVALFALLPVSVLRTFLRARLGPTLAAADPFWRRHFESAVGRLSKADILSRLRIQAEFGAARYRPEDLARWPGRVLILEAEDDPLFAPTARERLRALYPTAQVHQFQGTGHAAAIQHPKEYTAVVTRFFDAAV